MFVSRSLYAALQRECDGWATRYENLLEKYHALRLQNYSPRPVETPVVTAPAMDDASRVMNAQRLIAIEQAMADFQSRGMTPSEARQEAERAIDSLFSPIMGEFQ